MQTCRSVSVALCRLSSWFDALHIITAPSKVPGHLTVLDASGSEREVAIVVEGEARPRGLYIRTEDVNHRDVEVAFFAFRLLAGQLGYENAPAPVDRGPALDKNPETGTPRKLHYRDNFELVAMRHPQFRRSPNPPTQRYTRYMPIVDRCCRKFFLSELGSYVCQKFQIEIGDLKTFALLWTTNYLANWQLLTAAPEENDKLLTEYLKQCFTEFKNLVLKKGRCVIVDFDTAYIAQCGRAHEYHTSGPKTKEAVTEDVQRFVEVEKSANELEKRLAEMPHDEMVKTLRAAAMSKRLDADARRAASAYLKSHNKSCDHCKSREADERRRAILARRAAKEVQDGLEAHGA